MSQRGRRVELASCSSVKAVYKMMAQEPRLTEALSGFTVAVSKFEISKGGSQTCESTTGCRLGVVGMTGPMGSLR
jgi:hypothetical protein